MIARLLVGLLMITCFITLLASGCTQGEKTKPEGKSLDEITAKILAPGAEIDRKLSDAAVAKGPGEDQYSSGEDNTPEPFDGAPDVVGYPIPDVSSDAFVVSDTDPLTGKAWADLRATIHTNKGQIVIKFYHDAAPRHVENFVFLARSEYYNGMVFHRYVPGFVIQGGDPTGTGQGGPGYKVPAEISLKHAEGAVAAARQGDDVNPERRSSGSQYYICLDELTQLDDQYTVWGQVTEGMDIAMELREDDVMKRIEIM